MCSECIPKVMRHQGRVDSADTNTSSRIQLLHQQDRVPGALPPVGHDGRDPDFIRGPLSFSSKEAQLLLFYKMLFNGVERKTKLELVPMILRKLDRRAIEALFGHLAIVRKR